MSDGAGGYRFAGVGCLLLLLGVATGLVLLARAVPWQWTLGVMLGLLVGVWFLWQFGRLLLLWLVQRALRMKSRVLRGATLEVHACGEIDASAVRTAGPVAATEGTRFIELDVTIAPVGSRGGGGGGGGWGGVGGGRKGFRAWDPWDLALTSADADGGSGRGEEPTSPAARGLLPEGGGPEADEEADGADDLDVGWLVEVRDGSTVDPVDDVGKVEGAARLLLTFACSEPDRPATLRYWFESLGSIEYPWSRDGGDTGGVGGVV